MGSRHRDISRKEIYLFGSYARGEADAQSDLDFLIFARILKALELSYKEVYDLEEML